MGVVLVPADADGLPLHLEVEVQIVVPDVGAAAYFRHGVGDYVGVLERDEREGGDAGVASYARAPRSYEKEISRNV